MKKQRSGIPKARCEIRLPTELDIKLNKIALKAGVTKTSLLITAIERFVYGEDTQTEVETIHERVAVLTVGQDKLHADMLEIRAYLDALGQAMCDDHGKFAKFLDTVEKVKSELEEVA